MPVEIKLESCTDAGADRTALVDAVILVDETKARRLNLVVDDRLLDTFDAGPDVKPVANIRLARSGLSREALMWDSEEATSPKVTYTVQVSIDDGSTWQTIAVGSTSPEVKFDAAEFPGVKTLKVRVLETNGFNVSNETVQDVAID